MKRKHGYLPCALSILYMHVFQVYYNYIIPIIHFVCHWVHFLFLFPPSIFLLRPLTASHFLLLYYEASRCSFWKRNIEDVSCYYVIKVSVIFNRTKRICLSFAYLSSHPHWNNLCGHLHRLQDDFYRKGKCTKMEIPYFTYSVIGMSFF